MRPATPCPVPSKKRQTFIPTRAKRGTFGAPFHCQSRNSRVAWLLLDSEVIQRVEIAESPVKRAFRGVRPSATHGRCPASPLLWPRPTTAFAFAIARPPKFLTELSRRVVLLCPATPARPKPILAHGVGFAVRARVRTWRPAPLNYGLCHTGRWPCRKRSYDEIYHSVCVNLQNPLDKLHTRWP